MWRSATPTAYRLSLALALGGLAGGLLVASPTGAAAIRSLPARTHVDATSCHGRGHGRYVLPDPRCTPGALDPAVTQATIGRTICVSGWTSRVRPPESYTERLKWQQMAAYGEHGPMHGYEEDHLVPLELGGSPSSPRNLWPEPGGVPNPKDAVEDEARYRVCDGQISLAAARRAIATNWITFGERLGVLTPADVRSDRPVAPRW